MDYETIFPHSLKVLEIWENWEDRKRGNKIVRKGKWGSVHSILSVPFLMNKFSLGWLRLPALTVLMILLGPLKPEDVLQVKNYQLDRLWPEMTKLKHISITLFLLRPTNQFGVAHHTARASVQGLFPLCTGHRLWHEVSPMHLSRDGAKG